MASPTIRAAREDDRAAILALGPRLTVGAAPWRPRYEFESAATEWLDDSLAAMDAEHPVWVAEIDGAVVGVAAADRRQHFTGQSDCYLGELAVADEYEGRGIGRMLLAEVERWAQERDLPRVTLEAGAGNARALSFYESLGYRPEQVQLTRTLEVPDVDRVDER